MLSIILRDFVDVIAVFHLTQVDDAIGTVDDQVDLCRLLIGAAIPRRHVVCYDGYAQSFPDLRNMMQADLLKSIALLCVFRACRR